ncbi:MAG: IS30 family transposase [Acidimicrobiales bacterium]
MESRSMPANPLTAPEREEIRAGIARGETSPVIARRLGRHRSTISAEIARNGGVAAYTATTAQARADQQRTRPKVAKLASDSALAKHVTARLKAKDSPMTIAIELGRGTHSLTADISHETIYQAIYGHGHRGLPTGLHTGLHRRRRCRKHRVFGPPTPKPGPLGVFNLIGRRPLEADARTQPGHFEGDLIIGARNRSAIVTLFDRASRYCLLADLPEGHNATAVLAALVETFERVDCQHALTLTWDQGREMSKHRALAKLSGIDVHFAEPHSPWQRPTNESGNGLLRRCVGKGTDLSVYSPDDLRRIEHRLNTIPRRIHHSPTAHDLYTGNVAMTG